MAKGPPLPRPGERGLEANGKAPPCQVVFTVGLFAVAIQTVCAGSRSTRSLCPKRRSCHIRAVNTAARLGAASVVLRLSKMATGVPVANTDEIIFRHSLSAHGAAIRWASCPVIRSATSSASKVLPVPRCGAAMRARGTGPGIVGRSTHVKSNARAWVWEALPCPSGPSWAKGNSPKSSYSTNRAAA
jgi:hypothetical protein